MATSMCSAVSPATVIVVLTFASCSSRKRMRSMSPFSVAPCSAVRPSDAVAWMFAPFLRSIWAVSSREVDVAVFHDSSGT